MDNILHKRSVSFASVLDKPHSSILTSTSSTSSPSKLSNRNIGLLDIPRPLSGDILLSSSLLREDNCIVSGESDDWKLRYLSGEGKEEEEEEEGDGYNNNNNNNNNNSSQSIPYPIESTPKRKRDTAGEKEDLNLNSLVCKVYLVDPTGFHNRWRRVIVPSSAYCQSTIDLIADSFQIKRSPTFIAKRQFSDKYMFKCGAVKKNVKHAMFTTISDLGLESGDGLDITYGEAKFNFCVEFVRDSFSLKYNNERIENSQVAIREGVYIVGANPSEVGLL